MQRRAPRVPGMRLWVTAAALALMSSVLAPAGASHLEDPRNGLEEVGFHPLHDNGFNTDIWAWTTADGRLFGTSGTWGTLIGNDPCPSETDNPLDPRKSGVKIVDATDPAAPVLEATIPTVPGSQNNDVKVLGLTVGGFVGHDLLVHSLEPCQASLAVALLQGGPVPHAPLPQTGFEVYDVTEPTGPVHLGTYNNGALGTHNLYAFERPDLDRAFVAAVLNEQSLIAGVRGELQIVEVTDPTGGPTGTLGPPVSTWELADAPVPVDELCHPRGTHLSACVLHDVWVPGDGTIAYLSFWDAGLILLDISDPENPEFIGQIQSGTLEEEGNTHSTEVLHVDGRHLVVVGDEDFVGPGPSPHVVVNEAPPGSPVEPSDRFQGAEFTNTRPLEDFEPDGLGPLPAVLADDPPTEVHPGRHGCAFVVGAALTAAGQDWIAVARRGGGCPLFQQKVSNAEAAGASGIIVVDDGQGVAAGTAAGTIPGLMISQDEGERLIASVDNLDPDAVKVTLDLVETGEIDPWGFMRVVDVTDPDPANWEEVSTFKAPHVDTFPQFPQSRFSAHNPIAGPDERVYFSWYTNGVRVLEVAGDGATAETAWFVPLPDDHPDDLDADPHGVMVDNAGFWGSIAVCSPATGDLLVFNSDINRGMYILRALYEHPCGEEPVTPPMWTGGGRIPGSTEDGPASFGFNAGAGGATSGHVHVLDRGTGQRIMADSIASIQEVPSEDGAAVRIRGSCRVDKEDPLPCEVVAVDRGEPGTADEFHIEVRRGDGTTVYAAGGTLEQGNVKAHT